MPSTPAPNESKLPIEVYFGDHVLDAGIATVPKIFLRFYRYLVADGQRLNDRQAMLLTLVLALRQEQDFELRGSNLPTVCGLSRIERDKGLFRQMGLLFTSRIYYPTRDNRPPVLRAQQWDFRPLFFNLGLIWQTWLPRQQALVAEWESRRRKGSKPVYSFPIGFEHEVVLPPDVAGDIRAGKFFPVPDKWLIAARSLVSMPGADQNPPTVQNLHGRGVPTTQNLHGHLLVVDVVDDQKKESMPLEIPEDFKPVIELYQQAGHELRPDTLLRLRLMAQECDAVALTYDSTGIDWLIAALQRGLGVADDLLSYTAGVLRNWIAHGPQADPRPTREGYRPLTYAKPSSMNQTAPASRRDWDSH